MIYVDEGVIGTASIYVVEDNGKREELQTINFGKPWSTGNQNLGLAKRPETKLTLEKHITSLYIAPNAVGVNPIMNVDVTYTENENEQHKRTGFGSEKLIPTKSTRGERGQWRVETDIQELMQGATLEANYVYTIRNEGEEDYISYYLATYFREHRKQ